MFNLTSLAESKEILTLEYHFSEESLDLEFLEPLNIEILDNGVHVVTDNEGCLFIIQPDWVYISIIKRNTNDMKT